MELKLWCKKNRQSIAVKKMRSGVTIFQTNAKILAMTTVVLQELIGAQLMAALNYHAVTSLHSIVILKMINA
jgi:hypothetical protein